MPGDRADRHSHKHAALLLNDRGRDGRRLDDHGRRRRLRHEHGLLLDDDGATVAPRAAGSHDAAVDAADNGSRNEVTHESTAVVMMPMVPMAEEAVVTMMVMMRHFGVSLMCCVWMCFRLFVR